MPSVLTSQRLLGHEGFVETSLENAASITSGPWFAHSCGDACQYTEPGDSLNTACLSAGSDV